MPNTDELAVLIYDFKKVFNTDEGLNVLRDIETFCEFNQSPYVEGSFDRTAQKCGKQSVILHIKRRLAMKPEHRQQETQTERTPTNE